MGREGRDYWEEQLSEYWDSGLTIQEYSELKELPYESTRRWIRVLEKARQDGVIGSASLELVEVKSLHLQPDSSISDSMQKKWFANESFLNLAGISRSWGYCWSNRNLCPAATWKRGATYTLAHFVYGMSAFHGEMLEGADAYSSYFKLNKIRTPSQKIAFMDITYNGRINYWRTDPNKYWQVFQNRNL